MQKNARKSVSSISAIVLFATAFLLGIASIVLFFIDYALLLKPSEMLSNISGILCLSALVLIVVPALIIALFEKKEEPNRGEASDHHDNR